MRCYPQLRTQPCDSVPSNSDTRAATSIFEVVMEFLDDRVRKHLARHALHLGFRRIAIHAVQADLKILSLPDVLHSLVAHLAEGSLDRLSLGVENTLLQRDVYVSFHGGYADYNLRLNIKRQLSIESCLEKRYLETLLRSCKNRRNWHLRDLRRSRTCRYLREVHFEFDRQCSSMFLHVA